MSSSAGRRLSLWFPVAGALGVIYFVSSRSADQLLFRGPDYVAHAVEYFLLALLLGRALNGGMRPRVTVRVLLLMLGLSVVWAISDEWHQRFVISRVSSWRDVVSDTVGATLACIAFPYLARVTRRVFPVGLRSPAGSSASVEPAHLTFLTRVDCHLCHEAKEVLDRVIPDHDVQFEIVDVDSSPELASRYGHELPVLLLNGSKASKLRVDESRLRRRLRPWSRLT
jgi:VanZ family protein/glutaredoxin